MDNDTLIKLIRARSVNPATRTDWPAEDTPALAPPATSEQVARAEEGLGCTLLPLHRRLLEEVANGGFGPGGGLIGTPGGRLDDEGRSIVELQRMLFADNPGIGAGAVPLWDYGDGAWACVDHASGKVIIVDELGATDTNVLLSACMADWALGNELARKLFTFEERSGINPFTRKTMVVQLRGRPVGAPYKRGD